MSPSPTNLAVLQIVCLELEPYLEDFVRTYFKEAKQEHKLDIRIGDAVESMQQLADEGCTFDVVFLDANKTGYLAYYNLIMDSHLLAPTGFIVVDNALMKVCIPAPSRETMVVDLADVGKQLRYARVATDAAQLRAEVQYGIRHSPRPLKFTQQCGVVYCALLFGSNFGGPWPGCGLV